jgi:hypothetical protein
MSIQKMSTMIIEHQTPMLKAKIAKCKNKKFLSVLWIQNLDILTTFAVNSDAVYDMLQNNQVFANLLGEDKPSTQTYDVV